MAPIRIEEIMTKEVETASCDELLEAVVARMADQRISCVVVCEDRRPVGILSERDLARLFSESLAGGTRPRTMEEAMSAPVEAIEVYECLDRAIEQCQQHAIRRLVVVDGGGQLCGLVTQTDLLGAQRAALEAKVAERTRELEIANEQLRALTLLDGLLGIGNRRALDLTLEKLHGVAGRYDRIYSVLLVDVDHFKAFNDHYGHLHADDVLRELASALVRDARESDAVFRYGGEEFTVVLPETHANEAGVVAERLRKTVEGLEIAHAGAASGRLTVSVGVASSHRRGEERAGSFRDVLSLADGSLYEAKRSGRNRVGPLTVGGAR